MATLIELSTLVLAMLSRFPLRRCMSLSREGDLDVRREIGNAHASDIDSETLSGSSHQRASDPDLHEGQSKSAAMRVQQSRMQRF